MRLIANISMMFTELPEVERLSAAKKAGFDAVEIQFPHAQNITMLSQQSQNTGMPITLINVPRGPGDAVGLAALPGQEDAFRAAVARCACDAQALGVRKINILSGRPDEDMDPEECQRVLCRNLAHVADVMQAIGVKVMLEPVNRQDVPGFFISGLRAGLDAVNEVSHPNLAIQFDLYHMAITERDLCTAIRTCGKYIGHVQFADTPGRHQPGTGVIEFAAAIDALREVGYDDDVSAEYTPVGNTLQSLEWLADFKRMIA